VRRSIGGKRFYAGQGSRVANAVTTGDIIYDTWGYEQTNASFWQIVGKVGKGSIAIRPIDSKQWEVGYQTMAGYATPIKNAFTGPVQVKRVQTYRGRPYIKVDTGGATLWDGKPVGVSWYG
jgi:hypothetical protein